MRARYDLRRRLDVDAIVKVKTDWFAQFSSWSLGLEPGSLKVTPRGEQRADVGVRDELRLRAEGQSAAHFTGKARVPLELVMSEGGWRIASETGEALQ